MSMNGHWCCSRMGMDFFCPVDLVDPEPILHVRICYENIIHDLHRCQTVVCVELIRFCDCNYAKQLSRQCWWEPFAVNVKWSNHTDSTDFCVILPLARSVLYELIAVLYQRICILSDLGRKGALCIAMGFVHWRDESWCRGRGGCERGYSAFCECHT